jgi:hypothetical protein
MVAMLWNSMYSRMQSVEAHLDAAHKVQKCLSGRCHCSAALACLGWPCLARDNPTYALSKDVRSVVRTLLLSMQGPKYK